MIRNLRDLGGIETVSGKKIKKDKIFRSARLNEVDAADLAWFKEKNITWIIDLRTQGECKQSPDIEIPGAENLNHYLIDEDGGSLNIKEMRHRIMEAPTDEERMALVPDMSVVYREMVTSDFGRNRCATLLRNIMEYDKGSILFHCTSGKDRTGMIAALICSALGVDRELIYDDYLISLAHAEWEAAKMREDYIKQGASDALADKLIFLFTIDKKYLEAFFDEIEKKSGTVENYIRDELGIDDDLVNSFKERMLE